MSEENVEVVRRFYEAVNRRDLTVLDGLLASEESEFPSGLRHQRRACLSGPTGNPRHDFAAIDEAFVDFQTEVEGAPRCARRWVVAMTRVTGHGKGSGVAVDQRFAQVWTLQGAAVVRIDTYLNPAEALEAAGLRE